MSDSLENSLKDLISPREAAARCEMERKRTGTTVFTNGVFDILHRGHIEYLQAASDLGPLLIVGLNSDASVRRIKGSSRPLVSEQDRAYALLALSCVNCVVLFDEDTPLNLIQTITPDVLVKGGDYEIEKIVGYDHVTSNGGQVVTIPLREGYSTSSLIQKIKDNGAA